MKEDILEQLVDDFLMLQGYFTRHNLRFKPSKSHPDYSTRHDSVSSDIDVVGFHPRKTGNEKVVVVSCKSWQGGFDPVAKLLEIESNKKVSGREAWKAFRELCQPKWSEAFLEAVEHAAGTRTFTYYVAVTVLKSPTKIALWEENPRFRKALGGNPLQILTLDKMLQQVWLGLTQTPSASSVGRLLQLTKAAKWQPPT